MKPSKFALSATLLILVSSHGHASVIAGPIINPANDHAYYLFSSSDWIAAENEAITFGGHLVTINDSTENDWVYSTFSNYGATQRNLWIGLTDAAIEGTFVWTSGEPVTYLHWATNEPNNLNNEDYGSFYPLLYGNLWNDVAVDGTGTEGPYFGVAEVVPEPSSVLFAGFGICSLFLIRRPRSAKFRPIRTSPAGDVCDRWSRRT